MLESGKLTDQGEVESGGRSVRRLAGEVSGEPLTYDVDPATFAPVAGAHGKGSFTVERYEKLPLTDETAELLTLTPPAGAKVTVKDRPVELPGVRAAAGEVRGPGAGGEGERVVDLVARAEREREARGERVAGAVFVYERAGQLGDLEAALALLARRQVRLPCRRW